METTTPERCSWFLKVAFAALLLFMATFPPAHAGDEKQLVLGSGTSTRVVQVFFERLATEPECEGYGFTVQERSTKHAGGIRASGRYLFGRTGRPLNADEFDITERRKVEAELRDPQPHSGYHRGQPHQLCNFAS